MESGGSYPATLTITTPEKVANWRPLVHWLLAIPHFAVLYVLGLVSAVVAVISWFAILFTGKLGRGLTGFQSMYLRYMQRTYAYAGFLTEDYPPFGFGTVPTDPGDYQTVKSDFQPEAEDRNRLTSFFRVILVIPHAIVVSILSFVAYVVMVIAFFAVLFTGKWPEGLRRFVVGVLRWNLRMQAYFLLLTDEYPPFSLD